MQSKQDVSKNRDITYDEFVKIVRALKQVLYYAHINFRQNGKPNLRTFDGDIGTHLTILSKERRCEAARRVFVILGMRVLQFKYLYIK